MINLKVSLFILVCMLTMPHYGLGIDLSKLDSLLHILHVNNKAMISLSITDEKGNSYQNATGFSHLSDGIPSPSTTDTRYRIGSVTKIFTATMIFQLAEEGKIQLQESLSKYFPSIPNADVITILQLLQHRSGIYNFTDDKSYPNWLDQPKSREEMLQIIAQYPPGFKPGTNSSYSNSNYVILGYIIEDITGMSYNDALQERIVNKAGLSNTYIGGKTDINNHESFSFTRMINWIRQPETALSIPGGAGAIVSTPSDLVKFAQVLYSGKLVNDSSLAIMTTIKDGFGAGLISFPFYEKTAYGHTGGIDGFHSILARFPEEKVTIALCTNGLSYPLNDILVGILSIYFGKPYNLPGFENIAIATEGLEKYTGIYTGQQLPMKITIGINNNSLFAQATGQAAFPLTAIQNNIFTFEAAGIIMEFNFESREMILKQGGGSYIFVREN